MSYILDALKKSDQERRQGDVPDFKTVHIPMTQDSTPARWMYIAIVVLMLSLAFVLGMLRPWESKSVVQDAPQFDGGNESYTYAQKSVVGEQVENNIDEKVDVYSKIAAVEKTVSNTIPNEKMAEEKPGKVVGTEVKVAEKIAPSLDIDTVPYLHELPSLLQQAIPDMIFAGHVFSSQVDQRSVIINDHYMNEGDIIIDNLKVEQITKSGIVFNYNAQLFRMDILQNWSFD